MSNRLDSKPQIHTLAADLGLKFSCAPSRGILRSVETRVKAISKKFRCKTLNELLVAVANEVGTTLREIRSEGALLQLRAEYVAKGELIFANIAEELNRADDYGITIGLHPKNPWEPKFISIIDCRGEKSFRSYFTKWHELAHLLTLTPQMRLVFRRSHSRDGSSDPEEKLMDIIASSVGFLADFLPGAGLGELSFEGINEIRKESCPDASVQAATIGIVKAFPDPCILVTAAMAYKQDELASLSQSRFSFRDASAPTLRAVHATVNEAARRAGIQFFKNWRVPERSVIAHIFSQGGYKEAEEDLSWWSASGGKRLAELPVKVKAKKVGDSSVQALLMPIERYS